MKIMNAVHALLLVAFICFLALAVLGVIRATERAVECKKQGGIYIDRKDLCLNENAVIEVKP